MPLLTGLATVDASGNAMVDASAAYIQEPTVQVVVDTSGILMAGIPGGQQVIQIIADALANVILDSLLGGSGDVDMKQVATDAAFARTNATAAQVAAEAAEAAAEDVHTDLTAHDLNLFNHNAAVQLLLDAIHTHVENIENAGAGGLTEGEHNQLMGLPDSGAIAGDVWGYTLPMLYLTGGQWGPMAGTVLQAIGDYLQLEQGFYGRPIQGSDHFRICFRQIEEGNGWMGNWASESVSGLVPTLDLSLVQSGDTLFSYLQREYSSYGWSFTGPEGSTFDGTVWLTLQANTSYVRCILTDADIQACWPVTTEQVNVTTEQVNVTTEQVNVTTQVVEVSLPPVWPGLAAVTVGASVELSNGLTITGPMHGLIITITGSPSGAGRYAFGTVNSWMHAGSVVFQNDRGDYERAESYGLDTQVLMPRTMEVASAAIVRVNGGWTGTVRPWTRN